MCSCFQLYLCSMAEVDRTHPMPHICRFPLFSKGVDTYRFEYGVFLLNKNIELVWALITCNFLDG